MAPSLISHYRLFDQLGEGGMGVVYRAEDIRLGREVAIKLLRTDAVVSAEWLARFEREARLASSLKHPHICMIHELGEHDGQPFIAMERLEGRTMKQIIEDGPIAAGASDPLRQPDCGCARRRAPPRHHPPRHQAGQPVRHLRRSREGARLRPGEDRPRRSADGHRPGRNRLLADARRRRCRTT